MANSIFGQPQPNPFSPGTTLPSSNVSVTPSMPIGGLTVGLGGSGNVYYGGAPAGGVGQTTTTTGGPAIYIPPQETAKAAEKTITPALIPEIKPPTLKVGVGGLVEGLGKSGNVYEGGVLVGGTTPWGPVVKEGGVSYVPTGRTAETGETIYSGTQISSATPIGTFVPAKRIEITPLMPEISVQPATAGAIGLSFPAGVLSVKSGPVDVSKLSPDVQTALGNLQGKVQAEYPGFKLASWTREGDELKGVLEPVKYVSLGTDVTKATAAIKDLGLKEGDYKLYTGIGGDYQLVTDKVSSQKYVSGLLSSYSVIPITGYGQYRGSDERIALKFLDKEGYIKDGVISKDVQVIGDIGVGGTGAMIVLKGSTKSSEDLSKTYFSSLTEVQKEDTAMARGELQIAQEKELLRQPGMSVEKGAAWWNLNVGPYMLSPKDPLGLRSAYIGVEGLVKGTPVSVIQKDIEASRLSAEQEFLQRKYMGESWTKSLWEAPATQPLKVAATWYGGGLLLGGAAGVLKTAEVGAGIVSKAPWLATTGRVISTAGKVATSVPGQVVIGSGLYGFTERGNIMALAKGGVPRDIVPGMIFDASQFGFAYGGAAAGFPVGYSRGAGLGYAFKPGALPPSETFVAEIRGTGVSGIPGELQGLKLGTRVAGEVPKGFVPKGFSEGVPYRAFLQEGVTVTRAGEVVPSGTLMPTIAEMEPAKPLMQRIATAMTKPSELIPKMLPGGPTVEAPFLESIRYGEEKIAKGGTKDIYAAGYQPGTTIWSRLKMPVEGAQYGIAEGFKTVTAESPLASLTEKYTTRMALRATGAPIEAGDVVPVKIMAKTDFIVNDEGIAAMLKSGKNLADIEKLKGADIIQRDIEFADKPAVRYTRFIDKETGKSLVVLKQTAAPTIEEVVALAEEGKTLIKPEYVGGKVAGYSIRGTEIVGEGKEFAGGVRYKKGVEVVGKEQVTGIALDDKTFNALMDKYGNKILRVSSPTTARDIAALEASAEGGVTRGTSELSVIRYVSRGQFEDYLKSRTGVSSVKGGEYPPTEAGTFGTVSIERPEVPRLPKVPEEKIVPPEAGVSKGGLMSEGERVMSIALSEEVGRPAVGLEERPLRFTEKYFGMQTPSFGVTSVEGAGIISSDIAIATKSAVGMREQLVAAPEISVRTMLKPSAIMTSVNIEDVLLKISESILGKLQPRISTDITDVGMRIEPITSPIVTTKVTTAVDITPIPMNLIAPITTFKGPIVTVRPPIIPPGGGGGGGEGKKPEREYFGYFGRKKAGKRILSSDLFSVAVSQAAYGKATTPKFSRKEVSELESRGLIRVPTAEISGIPSSGELLKRLLGGRK